MGMLAHMNHLVMSFNNISCEFHLPLFLPGWWEFEIDTLIFAWGCRSMYWCCWSWIWCFPSADTAKSCELWSSLLQVISIQKKKDIYSIVVYTSHDDVNLFCCVIPVIWKAWQIFTKARKPIMVGSSRLISISYCTFVNVAMDGFGNLTSKIVAWGYCGAKFYLEQLPLDVNCSELYF